MTPQSLAIVILAAGQGKRMHSGLPKVLHPLAGIPLLKRVLNTAKALKPHTIYIVHGQDGDIVQAALENEPVHWVYQAKPLGTGHALKQALAVLTEQHVLVLSGDVPLISQDSLLQLCETTGSTQLGLLTTHSADPQGLGRVIRSNGTITQIIEQLDANNEQQKINEVYSGILLAPTDQLRPWLARLDHNNAQQEFYLTEIVDLAVQQGQIIASVTIKNEMEVQGINTRQQLIDLERRYQREQVDHLLSSGVTVLDPSRFDVRGELHCEQDVVFDMNVLIEGEVYIGRDSTVAAHCIIRNSHIGSHVTIKPYTLIEDSVIADHCIVGPYARLRPGTELAEQAHIGNFVEVKQSKIGPQSKVNHLSYIGDSDIGQGVNVGAGTITCNYDGQRKHRTIIEDNAFIGSGTQLVAPVTVGTGATIGAGSTVRKDAPAHALTINDSKQKTVVDWRAKREEKIP